jgi:hypothetical protein
MTRANPEKEIVPVPNDLITATELSVGDTVRYVEKVREVMEKVMTPEVDYGHIPGIEKPTLLKPGAEKLCVAFRLCPEYEELPSSTQTDGFIKYSVRCTLIHIPTGLKIATGMGTCNSRESKYKYRYVPSEKKPKDKRETALWKLHGLGAWRKIAGEWEWFDRVQHEEPYEFDNTIYKMACKRAHIAATLNGTAASAIFTQDVEDMEDHAGNERNGQPEARSAGRPSGGSGKPHTHVYHANAEGALVCQCGNVGRPAPKEERYDRSFNGKGKSAEPTSQEDNAGGQTYVATDTHMALEDAILHYASGDQAMAGDILEELTTFTDRRTNPPRKVKGKRSLTHISEAAAKVALDRFQKQYVEGRE